MEQFKPPASLSFEGNLSENWRRWEQRFRIYLTASGATEKSNAQQCAMLLASAGEDAVEVYNTFVFEEGTRKQAGMRNREIQGVLQPEKEHGL